jgi:agmatinase
MPQYAPNYGGLPPALSSYGNSAIVILPVPFDRTSTWKKGAARGPAAIIAASENMELFDIETGTEVCRQGIHTSSPIRARSPRLMIQKTGDTVSRMLDEGKFVTVTGGEHTVSLGSIRAHAKRFSNLSILQLDAHTDMRDKYEGEKYSHACVMARAGEIVRNIVQVGIRSMDSSELLNIDRKRVIFDHDRKKTASWMDRAIRMLTRNVYITIDLDVFDPSVMPSTGTPEPGGMDWYDVTGFLEKVIKKKNVVGFDVVELCPQPGIHAPDFLAAKLIYRTLSMIFKKRNPEGT